MKNSTPNPFTSDAGHRNISPQAGMLEARRQLFSTISLESQKDCVSSLKEALFSTLSMKPHSCLHSRGCQHLGGSRFLSLLTAAFCLSGGATHAANVTWIGGTADWLDAGSTALWSPADEPDSVDVAIFNTASTVHLGTLNSIAGLTLSGGIDLLTNGFDLSVDGLVQAGGASTNLYIDGSGSLLTADNVTIDASGRVELDGGILQLDEEVGASLLDLNLNGTLRGHGVISFLDAPAAVTAQFVNDGNLTAYSPSPLVPLGSPPPAGTLMVSGVSTNTRIDLDGASGAGVVNVNQNQTLDLNISLADSFQGDLNLFHNSTFDSASAWTLAGGTVDVSNGFVDGGLLADTPADVAYIKGGNLTVTSGTLTVTDTDGTLQFDSALTMSGGTLVNNGTVIFNATTTINSAPAYAPSSLNAQTVVNGTVTINDGTGNFNWDGNGAADTIINGTGSLSITASLIDTSDNVMGGTVTLNDSSDLSVNVAATEWTMSGTLTKNGTGSSTVSGDRIRLTGVVQANAGTLVLPAVSTTSTTSMNINGTLSLGTALELDGGVINGSGTLIIRAASTVLSSTTISTASLDWDGPAVGSVHTINSGAILTINSTTIDADGSMDDPVNLAGHASQLTVNGPAEWTQNGTLNANLSTAGTSVIAGTSRVIFAGSLNVMGNTIISAPVTFSGDTFLADIDAGMILDVLSTDNTYAGGTIGGAGTFRPGNTNVVIADSTISPDIFDFDDGSWTIQDGAKLTVDVQDYEADVVTNTFDSSITITDGVVSVQSADTAFVMDGTLSMNPVGGDDAIWTGQPIDFGNNTGFHDSLLHVTGDGIAGSLSAFFAPVTFRNDASVDVSAGGLLHFVHPVTFLTSSGGNDAEFIGSGTIFFSSGVTVSQALTLNLPGGRVDLDGLDGIGDSIDISAPTVINVATLDGFGKVNGGGGTNVISVNSNGPTGSLTVNLDDPTAQWIVNAPGVLALSNDNAAATLLAGNSVQINGTLNIIGDVRTTARLDLAGPVQITTAGEPLRLGGGDLLHPNTISNTSIGGPGLLGADSGVALEGHGTIVPSIDFDGNSVLRAKGGVLRLDGTIIDVGTLTTEGDTSLLHIPNPWSTLFTQAVILNGGGLQGGLITNNGANGISGKGLVTARVLNETSLAANAVGGTLKFQTLGNDNDWDGTGNAGILSASGGTLELVDNATFGFTGQVSATLGRIFANGFALDFNPGSTLTLNEGIYESTSSTDIGGTVVVNGAVGTTSTIKVANNFFFTFQSTSATTLNRDLILQNNNINIEAGATLSGTGALTIPPASHLILKPNAVANVLLNLAGTFRPSGFDTVGRVDVKDYQQSSTGQLFMEITGTALNQYDRVLVNGSAVLAGHLDLDIDGGFVPAVGQSFNLLSASGGLTGTFDSVSTSSMPPGLTFKLNYLPNLVQAEVISGGDFEQWISLFPTITNPADRLKTADPDHDGRDNFTEFVFDGDPTTGLTDGKIVGKIGSVAGIQAWTITFPMRGSLAFPTDPPRRRTPPHGHRHP